MSNPDERPIPRVARVAMAAVILTLAAAGKLFADAWDWATRFPPPPAAP